MAVSLLLHYPDELFHDRLAAVHAQLDRLPEEIAADFAAFLDWAQAASCGSWKSTTWKPLINAAVARCF